MIPLNRKSVGVAVAVAAQLGILSSMVIGQIRLLTTGREIVLPIVPVDPRDLFRGDYVTLSFPVSSIPATLIDRSSPRFGPSFYVSLSQTPEGTWNATRITAKPSLVQSPQDVVLKGRSRWGGLTDWNIKSSPNVIVQYGIERYYVPEGQGPRLERLARDKKLAAIVAVGADGTAAIKGLMIDGQRVYDEPLH
jgi:uncharacterized membrane-anchored protein